MTPKRRIALKKAQLASARKRHARRKKIVYGVAGGVTVALVGTGALVGRRYVSALKGGPQSKASTSKELDVLRGFSGAPLKERRVAGRDFGKATDKLIRGFDRSAKASSQKARRKRRAAVYNANRRRNYWKAKPVGRVGYSISTAGSRKNAKKRKKK